MNGQEFATPPCSMELPIIALVFDNASLGTIHASGAPSIPAAARGGIGSGQLPDFAAMARSFGGFGATVEQTERLSRPPYWPPRPAACPPSIRMKFDAEGISAQHDPVGNPGEGLWILAPRSFEMPAATTRSKLPLF
jgi:acetolactate synthase-1/2/3 large subunit